MTSGDHRVARFADPAVAFGPAALHRAFRAAHAHHRRDPEAAAFLLEAAPRIVALSRALHAGTWRPSPGRSFLVRDPKPRTVVQAGFADRVVHHALVAELERGIGPLLDPDSYACRRGRGLHRAVARAQVLASQQPYALGLDVRHYFAALPHRVVLESLATWRVPDFHLGLCRIILAAGAPDVAGGEPRGMPIGLLTSQLFGNVGLHQAEALLRRDHPALDHVRYMDDLLVFGPDRRSLWRAHRDLVALLRVAGLELKAAMTRLQPVTEGVPFCGLRVFPACVRVDHRSLVRAGRRVRRTLRLERQGYLAAVPAEGTVLSVFAHLRQWDTLAARRVLVRDLWP